MPTGFRRSDGTDLDQVFMAGGTGVAGFPFTFYPYTTGAYAPLTGYRRSDGTDLAYLFQNISVPLGNMVNPLGYNGGIYSDNGSGDEGTSQVSVRHYPDGTWDIFNNQEAIVAASGNWWSSAPQTGIGNAKYIRWTYTGNAQSPTGSGGYSANVGWTLLDTVRGPSVWAAGNSITAARRDVYFTIELSNDAVTVHSSQSVRIGAFSSRIIY